MGSNKKKRLKKELELYQRKVEESKDEFESKRRQLIREHSNTFTNPTSDRLSLELQWQFYQFCNCFPTIQFTIEAVAQEVQNFSSPTPLYKTAKPIWQLRNTMHHERLPRVSFVTQGNDYYTILYRQNLRSVSTDSQSDFNRYFNSMFTKVKNSNKQYAELLPLVKNYTSKAVNACAKSTKQL